MKLSANAICNFKAWLKPFIRLPHAGFVHALWHPTTFSGYDPVAWGKPVAVKVNSSLAGIRCLNKGKVPGARRAAPAPGRLTRRSSVRSWRRAAELDR